MSPRWFSIREETKRRVPPINIQRLRRMVDAAREKDCGIEGALEDEFEYVNAHDGDDVNEPGRPS